MRRNMTAAAGAGAGKHALAFIFVTALLDSIGFGIIMPVLPQLIDRGHRRKHLSRGNAMAAC